MAKKDSEKKLFYVYDGYDTEPYILVAMARSKSEVVEIGESISLYFAEEFVREAKGCYVLCKFRNYQQQC